MVQHVTEKVGDRGFAVGSRDSYPRDVVEGLPSQLDLSADLNTLLAQDFKGWVIPGNSRSNHHSGQIRTPGFEAVDVEGNAQLNWNAFRLKCCRTRRLIRARTALKNNNGLALVM
jgi:hypothetical protein